MDDQQTYLLNGLIARNFGLGRIVRFRAVGRGRQAETFEILTQQQHEYTVWLYPPAYAGEDLDFVARTINVLDRERFSVVPMVGVKGEGQGEEQRFVAEGPQGATMMVSLTTTGSAWGAGQYSVHDVSQVGLRLAWLHRLLKEQVKRPVGEGSLAVRLGEELDDLGPEAMRFLPSLPAGARENLMGLLGVRRPEGWVHGDMQPGALLLDGDHQIRTVVDFGLLHWGCPLEDLVDGILGFCLDAGGGLDRVKGRSLLEAYDSLLPLKRQAWTPVVAGWLGQRLLDAARGRRGLPKSFMQFVIAPEGLGTAIASCL